MVVFKIICDYPPLFLEGRYYGDIIKYDYLGHSKIGGRINASTNINFFDESTIKRLERLIKLNNINNEKFIQEDELNLIDFLLFLKNKNSLVKYDI